MSAGGSGGDRRAGFSLIEALVVLAVGSAALMIVFSIGLRTSERGFILGRRALEQADRVVDDDVYRTLVEGLVIRPIGVGDAADHLPLVEAEAQRLRGDVIAAKATRCAPAGPARQMTLEVRRAGRRWQVLCQLGEAPPLVLLESTRPLGFSYSEDGRSWAAQWSEAADPPARASSDPLAPVNLTALEERRVFVRLSTPDGALESIALARSGRPELLLASRPTEGIP